MISSLPRSIHESSDHYRTKIAINTERTCSCAPNNLNCLSGKEWLKSQIGVWQFFYEGRDIRDKNLHPATFPISLAKKVISLFSHEGELIVDPFAGSGTSLVAAQDLNRNAIGFDLQEKYIDLSSTRLASNNLFNQAQQLAIQDDALHIADYFSP